MGVAVLLPVSVVCGADKAQDNIDMFPKGTTATIAAMRFRILLAEYSECTNRGQVVGDAHGESAAACGGIQQLLNNNVYKHPSTIDADDVTVHRPTAQESSLLQLPVSTVT